MKIILSSASLVLAAGLTACGLPSQAQFGANKNSADQTGVEDDDGSDETESTTVDGSGSGVKKKAPPKLKSKLEPETPDNPNCPGVAKHEGSDTCDEDDRDVANGNVPTAQQPAEKPAEKPAETPPAQTPATPAPAGDPNIVLFKIKAGTGTSPWNTQAEMMTAKVGQTIRIVNEDTVTHRLHTGGAPCPHGANFAPGATYDCVVTKVVDPGTKPPTYDHIAGNNAFFWVKTTAQ